jgi:hypothetical protein
MAVSRLKDEPSGIMVWKAVARLYSIRYAPLALTSVFLECVQLAFTVFAVINACAFFLIRVVLL